MEMNERNVIIQVDSANAWAVKDLSYLYCDLFNQFIEMSDLSIRKDSIDKCLTHLITWVQKLGKYNGVIYNNFSSEKMELETRVNHVVININSLYAKDFKNINLFLGVLLDGIVEMKNAIERHKFVVNITEETLEIYDRLKSGFTAQVDNGIRIAQ